MKFRVTLRPHRLEIWEVEAESEEDIRAYWTYGPKGYDAGWERKIADGEGSPWGMLPDGSTYVNDGWDANEEIVSIEPVE